MRTSEQIDKIAEALAQAQAELKNPEKNQTAKIPTKTGGSYSYNYADLPHTLDTIKAPLARAGLSHTSGVGVATDGLRLMVRLMHTSGQWLESEIAFAVAHDPKTSAANITYFRRYLLTALVGVAADDDLDSEPEAPQATYEARRKPAQPVTSVALNANIRATPAPKPEKPSEFDSAVSGLKQPEVNPYAGWTTEKLEAYQLKMIDTLKERGITADQLKGDNKSKFDAVQKELTARGQKK